MNTTSLPIRQCNFNTMIVDSEITEGKLFQHDKNLTYLKAMIKASFKAFADGTKEHPYLIFDVEDLLQLKKEVDGDSKGGDNKEGKYYKQVWDIYMDDVVWTGIGTIKSLGSSETTERPFKGTYDGNGKTIWNWTIPNMKNATMNSQYGFFRAVEGATIKNLTINVRGIAQIASDNKLTTFEDGVGGAAFVGIVKDGMTLENCKATGFIGTEKVAAGHTAAGLICYVAKSSNPSLLNPRITIKNCVNEINIIGARKIGGFIGYAIATIEIQNSTNTGNLTRTNDKSDKTNDGIGAFLGFSDNDPADYGALMMTKVSNTGTITNNCPTLRFYGLLTAKNLGHFSNTDSVHIGRSSYAENVTCLDTMIVTNYYPSKTTLDLMHMSYSDVKSTKAHMTKLGIPNKKETWKVMIPTTEEKIILDSDYIYLDEEFVPAENRGKMPVYKADGTTKITGILQSGTTYKYTA